MEQWEKKKKAKACKRQKGMDTSPPWTPLLPQANYEMNVNNQTFELLATLILPVFVIFVGFHVLGGCKST